MIKQILITLLSFTLIDAVWILSFVMPQYRKKLPEDLILDSPNNLPAILFYLVFNLSLWFLVIKDHSGDIRATLLKAFVFGIATYTTYALTNLALIKGWNTAIALGDILWGGFIAVAVTFIVISTT